LLNVNLQRQPKISSKNEGGNIGAIHVVHAFEFGIIYTIFVISSRQL